MAAEEKDIVSISLNPGRTDTTMQKVLREQGKGSMSDADHASFMDVYEKGGLNKPEGPGHVIAKLALEGKPELSGKFLAYVLFPSSLLARIRVTDPQQLEWVRASSVSGELEAKLAIDCISQWSCSNNAMYQVIEESLIRKMKSNTFSSTCAIRI